MGKMDGGGCNGDEQGVERRMEGGETRIRIRSVTPSPSG